MKSTDCWKFVVLINTLKEPMAFWQGGSQGVSTLTSQSPADACHWLKQPEARDKEALLMQSTWASIPEHRPRWRKRG